MSSSIALRPGQPPRRSPVVAFTDLGIGRFKLDVEMCDDVGAIACVTALLEKHRAYLEWLEFGLIDPDQEIVKLRLRGRGPEAGVRCIRQIVAEGRTFADLPYFLGSGEGPALASVPSPSQRRLGITVRCLDRPFLCAEISRLSQPCRGNFARMSVRTVNSSSTVPNGGVAEFTLEAEIRTATMAQQNRLVTDVIAWCDRQVADDPQIEVLLTDVRLGVKLPDRPGRRLPL